ncbi:MAG: hypothetical protein INF91_12055 [Alphaproteobacteria bacterium]|nr:hypothetical protein [Alphaproteobacteria bacterium]
MQGIGYILSIISVLLLGIAAGWGDWGPEPLRHASLAGGVLLSIAGMVLRWVHHRAELRDRRGESRPPSG